MLDEDPEHFQSVAEELSAQGSAVRGQKAAEGLFWDQKVALPSFERFIFGFTKIPEFDPSILMKSPNSTMFSLYVFYTKTCSLRKHKGTSCHTWCMR